MSEERDRILKMVGNGTISATEGADLLAALEDEQQESVVGGPSVVPGERQGPWEAPVIAGVVVTSFGLLGLIRARSGGSLSRIGAVSTLLIGVTAVVIGHWSRNAPWLHVEVHESEGQTIKISLPLLLPLAKRVLDLARQYVDNDTAMQLENAAAFIEGLQRGDRPEPLSIEVDDGDGTRVMVYVG